MNKTHFRSVVLEREANLSLELMALRVFLFIFVVLLKLRSILRMTPSDEVSHCTLLCVEYTLLIFEIYVWLNLVCCLAEGCGLQADAVREVTGQAQVDQLRHWSSLGA